MTALWRRYIRERYITNLRNRPKGRRGNWSYYDSYHLLVIMPPRKPLNLRNERLDSAGSPHRKSGKIGSSSPFLYISVVPGSCAPPVLSDSHARYNGHSNRTVVLQNARSPLFPLTRRKLPYYWVLSLTRSPKSKPIMRNRTRRPVARDSNNRSLIQQLFWILRRPFPTFTDSSHNFLLLSGFRCRVPHEILFRAPVTSPTRRHNVFKYFAQKVNTLILLRPEDSTISSFPKRLIK